MSRKFSYFFICLFFLLGAALRATAQEGWHSIRQDYWPCNFNSVFFLPDGQNGWAVGSDGFIIHTTDGGSAWKRQTSGTSNWLFGVYFVDGQTGWVVGYHGIVLHTADGGITWKMQHGAWETYSLYGVFFIDRQTGWAVGSQSTLLHTTNGGQSWESHDFGRVYYFSDVYFMDAQTGWAVGEYGTILHTTDGGNQWVSQTSSTSNHLESVFFSDAQNGWAVGSSGTILHTTDGGNHWASQTSGTDNWLHSVRFADDQCGWAVGGDGTILHTTDGGTNWQQQTSGTSESLRSVYIVDGQRGWVVGDYGTILQTTDGGQNWESQTGGSSHSLNSVYFVDSQRGWAVGDFGTILHTTDGGHSWQEQTSGTTNSLESVYFTDRQNGWAVGSSGTILHTKNSGTSWQIQTSGTSNNLESVHFVDGQHGWAVGKDGVILYTADGGQIWQSQIGGTGNWLFSVFFVDDKTGWAVGGKGTILHTTDGGQNWQKQTSGTSNSLLSVHFVDDKTGWAVGGKGTALYTGDSGLTWQRKTYYIGFDFFDVYFLGHLVGWITGRDGTIFHTINGGINWRSQNTNTTKTLTSLYFANGQTGWAVGEYGIVLKYTLPRLVVSDNVPAAAPGVPFGFLMAEGTVSQDWRFQLKNAGRAAFTVQSWQSSNQAFSIISPDLPQTLSPNEAKEFTVRFSANASGLYQDSLSLAISGQDTSSEHTVELSGGALVSSDPLVRLLYRQAVAAYDSAKAYNPNSPAAHNNLGVLCAILNATREASSELAHASGKGTEMNRGTVNAIKSEYQQALSLWSNLLASVETPSYIKPQLNFNLAWVYDEIDSLERAYEYYTYVIGDSLANRRLVAKAYLGRGVTVFKMSRDSSAANENFRQAVALDPYGAGVLAQENMQAILTGVEPGALVELPQTFALEQNYPNPFNPETLIRYQLPEMAQVKLAIYNTLGQRIRVLLDGRQPPGYHSIRWDGKDERGRNVSTGVYLCRFQAGDFVQMRKMLLVR